MTDQPKEKFNKSEWPTEKQLLLKLAEVQFHFHRVMMAGAELIKNTRDGTKATANVKKSDLAALGVTLQQAANIKWPVRKPPLWKRFFGMKGDKPLRNAKSK